MSHDPFGAGLYLLLWLNLSLSGVGWSMGLNQGAGPAPLLSLLTGFALFCGFVHSRRPRRWIRALRLLSAAVALLLCIPRVLEGDLLGGMLLLVCFTMLALCFTLSQPREVFMLLLASLGPVLFGAGLYPQAGFRLLLSAWLLSAVLVLMQLQLARVRQRVDGFSGSGAWLAALPVSIAILALALLLYWLLPQPPAPYYALVPVGTDEPYGDPRWEARATADERPHRGPGGNEAGSGTGTGPGPAAEPEPQLNLFAGAPEDPPRRLLSVTSDEPVHLRTRVFDQFNGDSWSRSPAPARYVRLRDGLFERAPTGSSAPVRHTIEVLAELDQALPLAPVPHRIEIPSRVLRLDARGAIELPQPLRPGLRYRVKSSVSTLQGHRVSMEAAKLPGYRSLPAGSESICTLAGTIGGGREPWPRPGPSSATWLRPFRHRPPGRRRRSAT
ncbi:DUF3488 domain-containing protein [Marinobacterium aestuariivivens]|uniref:DUF3488 domain-containing protein n=1 Tax=Marinobacterium aestuariivivens TaxID=1698799 RepID=A0ABW2A081_9GAMM